MIYDKLINAKNYKGINDLLDKALDFISNLETKKLEIGKFEIIGTDLFYMVQEYKTIDEDGGKYESHKNYIDIQLLVSGNEYIRSNISENPEVTVPYNPDKDIEFYTLDKGYDFHLKNGTFALLMPGELHAPKLKVNNCEDVRKVVVKIKNTL